MPSSTVIHLKMGTMQPRRIERPLKAGDLKPHECILKVYLPWRGAHCCQRWITANGNPGGRRRVTPGARPGWLQRREQGWSRAHCNSLASRLAAYGEIVLAANKCPPCQPLRYVAALHRCRSVISNQRPSRDSGIWYGYGSNDRDPGHSRLCTDLKAVGALQALWWGPGITFAHPAT